jgi:Family of unknown function (DUF5995)
MLFAAVKVLWASIIPPMFPYDPILLAAVETKPESIDDVLKTMEIIADTCIDGDGLKWFNEIYLQVTQAVKSRVATGGSSDPEWLADLDVQFARLYFGALASALSGKPAPGCWQVLFGSRSQAPIARIQFALAGVNAHINHDLAEAIVKNCRQTGITPQHGTAQYNEYMAINATMDSLIDTAKQELNVRLLGNALPPVSHLENTFAAWSVSAARESAWNNAELLWHLQPVPMLASTFMGTLDGLCTVAGKALMVPVPELPQS